ncbi:hypothetical protein EMGBS15_03800 [Filimonas sp.]|jgi:hypothetical protein|nr:hypothetical protein EMGBS15_03800 [Filimonas sp.]
MAIKKTKEEVAQIRESISRKGPRKPIFFGQKIDDLKKGEGIVITDEEWKGTKLKTPLPSYYYSKYNKGSKKVISVVKTEKGYLVEKIG